MAIILQNTTVLRIGTSLKGSSLTSQKLSILIQNLNYVLNDTSYINTSEQYIHDLLNKS